jgi:hypothetical protein
VFSNRNQAIKKPGLNIGSAGITSVPGLFSELFNVAASRPAQMTTKWIEASPARAPRQGRPMVNPGRDRQALTFLFAFGGRLF